ncbi:hypothetical protein GCM10019017_38890 [Streptomyces showdoensis]
MGGRSAWRSTDGSAGVISQREAGGRVRAHGEGACERLPDPAAAPAAGEIQPVQLGGRADRLADVAREGEPDLGRGVGVGQPDLVQRHRPAELLADGGGDQVRGGALRHHPLGHPPGHRRLVVTKRQSPLRTEIVDAPGEPGIADSREGENRAELFVRPALLPGHDATPRHDTQTAATTPGIGVRHS